MNRGNVFVVIPNWNGRKTIAACLDSLQAQSLRPQIVVVENGSIDDSPEFIRKHYPAANLLVQTKNLGFAGGVNAGIRYAIEHGAEYIALFNNDAVADKDWLGSLVGFLKQHAEAGIATGKLLRDDKIHLDSTGEFYTTWGLPFPRGRDEVDEGQYDDQTWVFAATGGASLYRVAMLQKVGLFDEAFFAYYEDVDLSFRAQLAGWKVAYVPAAVAYHQVGATSSRIKGFTTYQTIKNIPWLFWKNVPWRLVPAIWPRALVSHWVIGVKGLVRGHIWSVVKGFAVTIVIAPKKLVERHRIQKQRTVSVAYIRSMIVPGLPPGTNSLRRRRSHPEK